MTISTAVSVSGTPRTFYGYGNYTVPLGDRLRLLGALDENGSMPIAEYLNAFQETKPVAGLAAMILNRYLEVDLDDAPLGPETVVRRISR